MEHEEKQTIMNNSIPVSHHDAVGRTQVWFSLQEKLQCTMSAYKFSFLYKLCVCMCADLAHVKVHKSFDISILLQSVGDTNHRGEGKHSKH